MLAVDIPIATFAGLALAEGGRGLIESQNVEKTAYVRVLA